MYIRFNAVVLFILFFLLPNCVSGETQEPLLSKNVSIRENRLDKITLTWKQDTSHSEKERILLFVPGPVRSATYSITQFHWQTAKTGENGEQGTEATFPKEENMYLPRITLREIGTLAGSRLAALSFPTKTALSRQTSDIGGIVYFTEGTIDIQFSENDETAFIDFPKALDPVAQTLVVNYPPLRTVRMDSFSPNQPAYFQTKPVKIITREHGIITLPGGLIHKNLSDSIPVDELALFRDRQPVPFVVTDGRGQRKTSGSIQATDFIQFYTPPSSSPFAPETVTWFARIPEAHIDPVMLTGAQSSSSVNSLPQQIVLEEDRVFIEGKEKDENQSKYWMWHDFVGSGTQTVTFSLPARPAGQSATVAFQIATNQSYIQLATTALYAELNGQRIGTEIHRSKPGEFASTVSISPDRIQTGTNTLVLNIHMGNQYKQSDAGIFLDRIEWRIHSPLVPGHEPYLLPDHKESIMFPQSNGGIWGIRNKGIKLGDVFYAQANTAQIESPSSSGLWKLFVVPAKPTISPVTLETVRTEFANHPVFTDRAGADVILIAPKGWLLILRPFEQSLRKHDYRVRMVSIEDIENLFGDGRQSPHHLREFLRHAFHHWERPQPSYVLLVGDATWDYWGRYRNGVQNYIPAYRENEKYAVENWFTRLDDPLDKLPDSIIARWPVQSANDLRVIVQKTLQYKNAPPLGPWLNTVFALTDDTFEKYSEELIDEWIPPSMRLLKRHIADYSLIDNIYLPERSRAQMRAKTSLEATDEIVKILSQGVFLWDYFGHGAPNVLGEERMFFGGGSKYSDVRRLTNKIKLPMLWAFTCQTAEFDYPGDKWNVSIGEDMLAFPDGGAVALVGATGRGYPTDHIVLARGMHQAAFRDKFSTLGQIFFAANLYGLGQMAFFEPLDQFVILGDPTICMPEFHTMEGTARRESDGIAFEWNHSPGAPNPGRYSVWAETEREIVPDRQIYRITNPGEPVQGVFKTGGTEPIHKIGIDAIERKNNGISITHGSVELLDEKQAAPVIEPATGRLPELTFVPNSLSITPLSPRSGETVFLDATVRNDGQASAQNISIQGHDTTKENTPRLLNVVVGQQGGRIGRLDPGEKAPVRIRWDPTDNAGRHNLRLTVDADKRIDEPDEDNNTISGEITVLRKADLIVDASSIDIRPIEDGKRLQVYFEIRNVGESPAEKIVIELDRKDAGIPNAETFRFPRTWDLQPGKHFSFGGIKIPANIEYLDITIDPDEIIDEETHGNNTYRYEPGNAQ